MDRIFSGIQPSGEIHIGNYVGAIRNWAQLVDRYECIFSVVDYHAITIEYDVSVLPKRVVETATVLVACGLTPGRCTVFVQSHVPEHTELAWVFNSVTPIGELERMTQFKEKGRQHRENINMGLLGYPVLQAADILIYKAKYVPVGEDQVQHVELAARLRGSSMPATVKPFRNLRWFFPARRNPGPGRAGEDVEVDEQHDRPP